MPRTRKAKNKAQASSANFASVIDHRLKELGWNRSDLARRLQVTPSRIRALLLQPSITETVFVKVCQVLGLQIQFVEVSRPEPPEYHRKPSVGMVVEDPDERGKTLAQVFGFDRLTDEEKRRNLREDMGRFA